MLFDSASAQPNFSMRVKLAQLCKDAEEFARTTGGILVLSDKDVTKGSNVYS